MRTLINPIRIGLNANLTAIFAVLTFQAQAQDWQTWNQIDLTKTISPQWHLTVPLVLRESFNLANPQLFGAGAILEYAVNPHVGLSGGYLYVGLPNLGPGYDANVPLAAVTFRDKFASAEISDRNRVEQLFGIPGVPVRYRNKLSFSWPLKGGPWIPFVNSEVFLDCTQKAWEQNRFEIGVGTRLDERFKLDTYYLERTDFQNRADDVHALGLTLEIDLNDHPPTRK